MTLDLNVTFKSCTLRSNILVMNVQILVAVLTSLATGASDI
jgi:hypothetical protein